MFNAQDQDTQPQPPSKLETAAEIASMLRNLQQANIPLTLTFDGRNERFLSYIAAINADQKTFALDELVPNQANRHMERGDPFQVEAYIDGIKATWRCLVQGRAGTIDEHRCYWFNFPGELVYHQRRNAYRAPLLVGESAQIQLAGNNLKTRINGELIDLSAHGCKVHIEGENPLLQSGRVYDLTVLYLPGEALHLAAEVRHFNVLENDKGIHLGLKFHQLSGQSGRSIERYVYHLQREARRQI